jgi:hypothetical protein
MWMTEWRAISARIMALTDAGTFFTRIRDNDNYTASDILINNALATASKVQTFLGRFGSQLPIEPRQCLEDFSKDWRERFNGLEKDSPSRSTRGVAAAGAVVTALACVRADFEYLIADTEAKARNLVVRAFTHLQSSIVADETIGARWRHAFDLRETACERLGACHLLQHGIWAFKTSAEGERTDLVLGIPLEITAEVRSASDGLILTEWKVVKTPDQVEVKAEEAYRQAKRYCEGILAGYEVASRRYLILVSEDHLTLPSTRQEDKTEYEFRNIAVNPKTPSGATKVGRTS